LNLLIDAIEKAGHQGKVSLAMDVAASEFFISEKNTYDLDFKTPNNNGSQRLTSDRLTSLYEDFISHYPIVSIEDPFD